MGPEVRENEKNWLHYSTDVCVQESDVYTTQQR